MQRITGECSDGDSVAGSDGVATEGVSVRALPEKQSPRSAPHLGPNLPFLIQPPLLLSRRLPFGPSVEPTCCSPVGTSSGFCGRPHQPSDMRTKRAWPPAVASDQHRGCDQHVLSRTGHKTDPELVLYGLQGLSCLRIVVPHAPHWTSQVRPRRTVTSVIRSQLLLPGSPCLHPPTAPAFPDFAFPWKACLRAFARVIFSA